MPDVETELGRFGRWLDTEIDVRVEDGAALALSTEPAVNSARRRGRLAAAIGVAVALAVGVLVVTSRRIAPAGGRGAATTSPTTVLSSADQAMLDELRQALQIQTASAATTGAPAATASAPTSTSAAPATSAPGGVTDFSDPRLVLPGRDLPAGFTISTTASGDSVGAARKALSVLYGRRGADGSWTHLLVVQVSTWLTNHAQPAVSGKQVRRECGCALASFGGHDLVVSGAASAVDEVAAVFDDVVLGPTNDFAWAAGAPPDGLEEIARASAGDPARATAQIVGSPSPGGVVATVNGEVTGDPLATMFVQTASVPVDTLLATDLPITWGGTLRKDGAGWRYESDGEWAVLKVVSPGTATSIRVDGLFDRSVADSVIDSLHLVDAASWMSAGPKPHATYTVLTGDTLAGIALKLGVPYQDLLAANQSLDPAKFLIVGQRLNVPTG